LEQLLTDNLNKIHDTALKILDEIGINLLHPEVLDIVAQKGITVSGQKAYFDPHQVMDWVGKAPREFTIHARNPKYDAVIGGNHMTFAPGYGCAQIIGADGSRRDAFLADYIAFAKLTHQSEYFNWNGGILAQPADVPAHQSHLIMLYAAAMHSDKCLLGIPGIGQTVQEIMDLMGILFGGKEALIQKPRILTLINTMSPLQIDEIGLQSMLIAARHRQPMIISPVPATGTTGPISMAGNLAMATAEALAGIAVTQMISEGVPVLFGALSGNADLKTGSMFSAAPVFGIQCRIAAGLARMLKLPSRGNGTLTDAKWVGVQSGYESMMTLLTSLQSRHNFFLHCAGILDSFAAMSYEQYMIDLEIMRRAFRYLQAAEFDEAALSFDVIKNIGPGGEFLTSDDTLQKVRTHAWTSEIDIRDLRPGMTLNDQLQVILHTKLQHMLENYQKPEMDADIQKSLEQYLVNSGIDQKIIDAVNTGNEGNHHDLWQS
jgi:trimethylamine--corrinoid protein Co-methyltransferase